MVTTFSFDHMTGENREFIQFDLREAIYQLMDNSNINNPLFKRVFRLKPELDQNYCSVSPLFFRIIILVGFLWYLKSYHYHLLLYMKYLPL